MAQQELQNFKFAVFHVAVFQTNVLVCCKKYSIHEQQRYKATETQNNRRKFRDFEVGKGLLPSSSLTHAPLHDKNQDILGY